MSERPDTTSYIGGVRKAMVRLALPPIVLCTLLIYWWLWGPAASVGHTVFWLALSLILVELLLIRLHRRCTSCRLSNRWVGKFLQGVTRCLSCVPT